MYKLDNFNACCDYLGIDNTLPVCQIDERQIQAVYKLRVCMKAWNRQDGFEPNEKAVYYQENAGYTPHFDLKDGMLLPSGIAIYGSAAGLVNAIASNAAANPHAYLGLRLSLKTRDRAVEFSETFIDIFNELI